MICTIYKGLKKQGSYLYIKSTIGKKDDFSNLPESLLTIMGKLELVMQLKINQSTKLAQAQASEVLAEIDLNGFYLQLPDPDYKF
jgi:uncharacterized protein YcgL (UPF0745 family)